MRPSSYKGNLKTVDLLSEWLELFFSDSFCYAGTEEKQREPYVILHGPSGNGKSFLVESFAKEYDADILEITSDDIMGKNGIDVVEKSLNLHTIGKSKERRIILIEDITSFKPKSVLKRLSTFHKICSYPIIFTASDVRLLPNDFVMGSLSLEVKKPFEFEIKAILEQEINSKGLVCDCIDEIAGKSTSVRTALQSLSIGRLIEKEPPNNNSYALVFLMSKRALQHGVNWYVLKNAFDNISDCNKESYQLMERLCKYDYIIHRERFGNKDALLDEVYFTIPNIELVKGKEWKKKKKIVNEKVEVEKEVKESPVIPEKEPVIAIQKFINSSDNEWE